MTLTMHAGELVNLKNEITILKAMVDKQDDMQNTNLTNYKDRVRA